jgi:DNA modification methylase
MMKIIQGDCVEVMAGLRSASFDAVVCDPPYGLEFMGKEWDKLGTGRKGNPLDPKGPAFRPDGRDNVGGRLSRRAASFDRKRMPRCGKCGKWQYNAAKSSECSCNEPEWVTDTWTYPQKMQAWHEDWLRAAFRVAKPGAYLLAFGGTRTFHRLACALEDAGWQLVDTVCWLYGCLSEDTEILTEKGWEPYHKTTTGSLALAYNVDDDSFNWEPIQEVLVYDYRDTAYRLVSDSTDQLVSRNHRCLVERGGGYAFQYAEALPPQVRVPVLEGVQGLLEALPLPQRHAGATKRSVRARVPVGDSPPATGAEAAGGTPGARQGGMCRLRQGGLEVALPPETAQDADLLPTLQRHLAGAGVGQARAQGACGLDAGRRGVLQAEDERAEQPCVEGRRHPQQQARQLRLGEVRPLPAGAPADGAAGRLRDGTPTRGGADSGALPDAQGSGSPRQPRPDGQPAGEPTAVRLQPGPQAVRASRFARPDLVRVVPCHYEGKVWCVRVPSGAFVARRNGKVFVTGNSGFPKHRSKLKPAWEPVLLAWKPARHATPLQIDACRVGADVETWPVSRSYAAGRIALSGRTHGAADTQATGDAPAGRWPANLVLSHVGPDADGNGGCVRTGTRRVRGTNPPKGVSRGETSGYGRGWGDHEAFHYGAADGTEEVAAWRCVEGCPVRQLDAQAGERCGTHGGGVNRQSRARQAGFGLTAGTCVRDDAGGPSRFFYCAKASRKDRGEGNTHPTVKPVSNADGSPALMRWLVRLVTPPGGHVLDPFAGSGSTGLACVHEGFRFTGIEQSKEYVRIARRRLSAAASRSKLGGEPTSRSERRAA